MSKCLKRGRDFTVGILTLLQPVDLSFCVYFTEGNLS